MDCAASLAHASSHSDPRCMEVLKVGAEIVRFLHASDFRLEQPLHGLGEVPASVRKLLIDAPFESAKRVFDAALAEGVRFVVLSGDLLDLQACEPRSIVFLTEQFARLAQNKIDVYWAGGSLDSPTDWPAAVSLPDNVYIFGTKSPEEFLVEVNGEPIAAVVGLSSSKKTRMNSSDWTPKTESLVSIAVTNGRFDRNKLASANIDYWALGGQPNCEIVSEQEPTATYAGSPQGRGRHDEGGHGCQVVQVLESGEIKTRLVETDSARWRHLSFRAPKEATKEKLENLLGDQLLNVAAEAGDRVVLASIEIQCGAGPGNDKLAQQLTDWARKEFGGSSSELWIADLRITPPKDLLAQWGEEDSILGDFLRTVSGVKGGKDACDFSRYLPTGQTGELLTQLVTGSGGMEADLLLREAAKTGVDLLRGEDAA
jgi:DNA repair exonuclease SbcCD nuclease subunit